MFTTPANTRNTMPARIHARPLTLPRNASTAATDTQLETVRHMVKAIPNARKKIIWRKSVTPVRNKRKGNPNSEQESLGHTRQHVLLNRCRERGPKLNKKKLRFKLSKVAYMGHILGADGLQADPEKIKVVCDVPCPTDVQGVQCLIGVVTYLSKFLPQLSNICEPLRHLTDSNCVFDWLPQHKDALARIKELTTQAPVLHCFDIHKEVTIKCDSSDVGLGTVITQDGYPHRTKHRESMRGNIAESCENVAETQRLLRDSGSGYKTFTRDSVAAVTAEPDHFLAISVTFPVKETRVSATRRRDVN